MRQGVAIISGMYGRCILVKVLAVHPSVVETPQRIGYLSTKEPETV